ncbi:Ig-like domain-containing protein [Microbulbifer sp. GL-2]|uniref:Ig-like domain-containing protein n=1 Tax=Microbulbifer sp. GL-2 TaxID=2591606 RepID=UPI001163AEBD|nr:Ig-like domain-containing protein [Microbulbifer sp. GL-2]BBM01762.1 hypothetical protein GL2_18360 [Microbulbifer sp. GL-2]
MKAHVLKGILYAVIVSSLSACSGGSDSDNPVNVVSLTISLSPISGSTLSLQDSVLIDFSEAVDLGDITLSGDMEKLGKLTQVDNDTLNFSPLETWTEGETLSLLINAKDVAGNAMQEISASYKVEVVAPAVVSISPDRVRLEKSDTITVQFSETMDSESLLLTGSLSFDEYDLAWSKSESENDTLSITPKAGWVSGQKRTITIEIADNAGNILPESTSSFTVPLYFKNFDAAQVVIGQEDFSSTVTGLSEKNIAEYPVGAVAISADKTLFLSDTKNNRVLAFNEIPEVNGAPASFVLGQEDFYSAAAVSDSSYSNTYGLPSRVSIDNNKLVVTQSFIRRIFVYDSVPENGEAIPLLALGLRDGDGDTCNSAELSFVEASIIANGKIIVADTGNSRVLIWDKLPEHNDTPANFVVGQSVLSNCLANDDNQDGSSIAPTARTLSQPNDIWSDGEKLAVVDTLNNRVLLWNTFPKNNFVPADVVLGQESFFDRKTGEDSGGAEGWLATNKTFNEPYLGIWSNGIQLFVVDGGNHRVLIWDQWPEVNFTSADLVLGQTNFEKSAFNDANQNGVSDQGELPNASTLKWPEGVIGNQDKLFVTDSGNNRVLIFKSR